MSHRLKGFVLLALICSAAAVSAAGERTSPMQGHQPQAVAVDRIIVRWSKDGVAGRAQKLDRMGEFAGRRAIDARTDVIELSHRLQGDSLNVALERLRADPAVVYASPDLRRHAHAVTNDPLLTAQWYLSSVQPSATRTDAAWDITTGDPAVVVAVLDTGVRFEHPDLGRVASGGKLLPGYDFITNAAVANDGDGRDPDPSDPGDWVTESDRSQTVFADCDPSQSSWHGTRVAGLIGAITNNAEGVAGAAFDTRVLPVRVMGKCGGFDSDIIVAMRWAAGLHVPGVPDNPTPASVINLSLGSSGVCTAAYQSAVDEIISRGVLIVASAGNEGGPVDAPANCTGVLGVAGIRHVGTKVGFSNLGPEIALSAPGGNCVNVGSGQPCLFSIVVAVNSGKTSPLSSTYTDEFNYNVGTSFSAPQAAAAAALMRSVNSRLEPAQLIRRMKETATPFPGGSVDTCHVPADANDLQISECACTTSTCGAGMLNAGEAVAAARKPFAVLRTSGPVRAGSTVVLDAADSFPADGHTLTTFAWSVIEASSPEPVIASPSQPSTTLSVRAAGTFTLRLVVTDESGAQDMMQVVLNTAAQPAGPTSSHRGGGGPMTWELLALTMLWLARATRTSWKKHSPKSARMSAVSSPARADNAP